ncbi:MAG TPA: type II toxin-antitoxin system Phd/YefM family antitoxin [Spirochaetota bacterium]|nr:type II toxin-antitoxin system Phd/YefM family antitoxin [Spirochaetota bacterium]HPJ40267.1 type II toxin-antitoxin system Phd/YefM family antitoxin [Spirochaetota bacterium]HPQ55338.1 type II toxin-antitoxin system Phd/YefM family antitoxin [Spirochaetota bacterium]
MNIKEDIKPISYIKSHAADILKYINENRRPVIITQNGEAKGVFIDSDSYQNMKNTMSLMKMLLLAETQVSRGETVDHDKMFKEFDRKFEDAAK